MPGNSGVDAGTWASSSRRFCRRWSTTGRLEFKFLPIRDGQCVLMSFTALSPGVAINPSSRRTNLWTVREKRHYRFFLCKMCLHAGTMLSDFFFSPAEFYVRQFLVIRWQFRQYCFRHLTPCAGNWLADHNEWPKSYTTIPRFLFLLNS